jgi:hypothetical protein
MWTYKEIAGGSHMAPLTHPDLVNPLVKSFLRMELCDDRVPPTQLVQDDSIWRYPAVGAHA